MVRGGNTVVIIGISIEHIKIFTIHYYAKNFYISYLVPERNNI